jgi:hypothetical protein
MGNNFLSKSIFAILPLASNEINTGGFKELSLFFGKPERAIKKQQAL